MLLEQLEAPSCNISVLGTSASHSKETRQHIAFLLFLQASFTVARNLVANICP
jgi:hypothetical protein